MTKQTLKKLNNAISFVDITDTWKHGAIPLIDVSELSCLEQTPWALYRNRYLMRQTSKGRSMVEMIGVLAIIGVLSIGSLSGYQYALKVIQANRVFEDVQNYRVAIMNRRRLSTSLTVSSFPNVKTVSGYTFEIAVREGSFDVLVRGVPKNVCESLLQKDDDKMRVGIENGTTPYQCTTTNNMFFGFLLRTMVNNDGGTDSCASMTCSNGSCNNGRCYCNKGYYGTSSCSACPAGTTTASTGATSASACYAIDPCDGINCGNGVCSNGTCTCNIGYYGISSCSACPSGTTTNTIGATSASDCAAVDPCDSIVCNNGGTCSNGVCTCSGNWTGTTCTTCGLTCSNGGTANAACTSCTCSGNWTGSTCTTCGLTCNNGGSANAACTSCTCSGNWTGTTCTTCGLTCNNGGSANAACTSCTCSGNWTGTTCTTCGLTCNGNGTANAACTSCTCSGNWTGTTCTTCGLTCNGNGTANAACTSCTCSGNWTGTTCTTCGLTCNGNGTANAACTSCTCNTGWTGTNCETPEAATGNCGNTYSTCDSTCSTSCTALGYCNGSSTYYSYTCSAGSCVCNGMGGTPLNNGTTYINCCLCLAEGTLITLSDGSEKPIEDIDYTDELRVWDFDNGCFTSSTPLWIKVEQQADEYNLLTFEDGRQLKTISQHRIFNKELGKFSYPMTDETPIATTTFTDEGKELKLKEKHVVHESVRHFNIITKQHFNCFANGVLTSCRLNNLYPIENMKFVKDNRALSNKSLFAALPDEWIDGLRLTEQHLEINHGNDVNHGNSLVQYVLNCIATDKKSALEKVA